jgi:hypothetical protein
VLPEALEAAKEPSPIAPRTRLLLICLAVQVLAQVPPMIRLIQAVPGNGDGPLAIAAAAWIRAGLGSGLLVLIALTVVEFVRRPGSGGPVGFVALGAALAAQAFLVRDAVLGVAQAAPSFVDPGMNTLIGVLVFLLTAGAYLSLPPPMAGAPHRLRSAAIGSVAILIVLAGSLASATRPSSPVACLDVTREVGISFRGALGTTVVDGSDRSVEIQQNNGNGVAVGDYDQDGDLDLYLLGQPGHENRLYRNDHSLSGEGFTDVTDAAGLGEFSGSRAAQFVDLDGDGLLDLVAVNDSSPGTALQPSRIYGNLGSGRFRDVTAASGFDPAGLIVGGMGIADYDRDGLPDVYVTYWTGGFRLGVNEDYGSHNLLFRNLGGIRFEDVTAQVGLGSLSAGSFTPMFADLNGDAWPDLYVAVDAAPEVLYLNDHGTFRDATAEAGLGATRNGMGAALADPEGVGIPSVFVTNITEPDNKLGVPPGGNALLRSRLRPGGQVAYVDDAAGAGIRDAGWAWGATFTDLDLDGHTDLFVAQGMDVHTRGVSAALTGDTAHVFVGNGSGTFVESSGNGCDIPGDQRAVVAFDYDRDGAPDLLVSQVLLDFKLLENRSEPRGHWLTVVAAPAAGHTVVGAKITVIAGGKRWVQSLIGGGGYLSGPPNEAYFGLGPTSRVAAVTIDWPDGTTTSRSDVTADRLLLMQQP